MDYEDPFHPDNLRVTPEQQAKIQEAQNAYSNKRAKSPLKHALPDKGDSFVKGPLPMSWFEVASRCGDRGVAVGLALFLAAGRQSDNPVTLYPTYTKSLGVHRLTVRRVLDRMEQAGIVRCEHHHGRAPRVLILEAPNLDV